MKRQAQQISLAALLALLAFALGRASAQTIPAGLPEPLAVDELQRLLLFARHSLGSERAPHQVLILADYACPYCQAFYHGPVWSWLQAQAARGQVQLFALPLPVLGEISMLAAQAAECAGEQGHFWAYHQALYDLPGLPDAAGLAALALQQELEPAAFSNCLASSTAADVVRSTRQTALDLGIDRTPFFLVDGRPLAGNQPLSEFQRYLRKP